jgi:hypothetical protein
LSNITTYSSPIAPSLASASSLYKSKLIGRTGLKLPCGKVTVTRVVTVIAGTLYVKLYAQSMTGNDVIVDLGGDEDAKIVGEEADEGQEEMSSMEDRKGRNGLRRQLESLGQEGTERVMVVGGVKWVFVGVDR